MQIANVHWSHYNKPALWDIEAELRERGETPGRREQTITMIRVAQAVEELPLLRMLENTDPFQLPEIPETWEDLS